MLAAVAVAVLAAGCGGSTPGPRKVTLSLLAPTDGVTVNVHALVVYGKVAPATATVVVGGRDVTVVKGTFKQPLLMRGKVVHIRVSAQAHGYQDTDLEATVHYKPGPRSASTSDDVASGIANSSLGAQVASVTSSSSFLGAPHPAGSFTSPSSRSLFINGCMLGTHNRALCGCMYDKLAASPQLKTQAGQYAFAKQTLQAVESGSPADLPAVAKTAAVQCAVR